MAIKINLGETFILRVEPDESGVISYKGGIYAINEICVLTLNNLYEGKSIETIINTIVNEYDVTIDELKIDLDEFFFQLKLLEIISLNYYNNLKRGLAEIV